MTRTFVPQRSKSGVTGGSAETPADGMIAIFAIPRCEAGENSLAFCERRWSFRDFDGSPPTPVPSRSHERLGNFSNTYPLRQPNRCSRSCRKPKNRRTRSPSRLSPPSASCGPVFVERKPRAERHVWLRTALARPQGEQIAANPPPDVAHGGAGGDALRLPRLARHQSR